MRSRLAVIGAPLLGLLLLGLAPTPAAALSCATNMSHTPAQLLRGATWVTTVDGAETLFDSYDYALVGRVTAIRPTVPPPTGADASFRRLSVDVEVLTAFNRAATDAEVTITMGDRGEMLGYPFEIGRTYFMVVRDAQLGVCGPTAPIDAADVPALQSAAREGGVTVAVPPAATTPAAAPAARVPAAAGRPAGSGPAALVAGVSVVALGGLAAGVAVRSRRRDTAGDDAAGSGPGAAT